MLRLGGWMLLLLSVLLLLFVMLLPLQYHKKLLHVSEKRLQSAKQ